MGKLPHAANFRDLIVYQKARALAREIFEVSTTFPKEEMYSLTDQLRRASRSVGGQIAEAWGKRRYERHFVSKLTDADSEQYETQHWLETALDCDYLDEQQVVALVRKCEEIGRLLGGMMDKAHLFCRTTTGSLCEPDLEYYISE